MNGFGLHAEPTGYSDLLDVEEERKREVRMTRFCFTTDRMEHRAELTETAVETKGLVGVGGREDWGSEERQLGVWSGAC